MIPPPVEDELALGKKCFDVVARRANGSTELHFLIIYSVFVGITAIDDLEKLLLVLQLRPAISGLGLEPPPGHVESGEAPKLTARHGLLDETGHLTGEMELLTTLQPAIGRYTNRMWSYFTSERGSLRALISSRKLALSRYDMEATSNQSWARKVFVVRFVVPHYWQRS